MIERDFSTCANPDCENPNQGLLTEKDYHKATSARGQRQYNCRQCVNTETREKYNSDRDPLKEVWDVELAEQLNRQPFKDIKLDPNKKIDVGYNRGEDK